MLKVAICGKIRSGKDTLGEFFLQKGLKEFKFGDGIREVIEKYYPTVMAQGKPRKHYQHIGQQLRVLDEDVWVNYTLSNIRRYCTLYPTMAKAGVVITDMRQPNEAKVLREQGYFIVKVVTEEEERLRRMKALGDKFTKEDLQHETELNVDKIEADFTIHNNGSKKDLYIAFVDMYLDMIRELEA